MIDYDGINSVTEEYLNSEMARMIPALTDAMRDGEVTNCQLHYEWQICDTCRGHGGHSRRLGVINRDDWDDEDFYDYMAGAYNATCEMCNGSGKVRELEVEMLPQDVQDWVERYQRDAAEDAAVRRWEMLNGC
jgi:hypothetical protein